MVVGKRYEVLKALYPDREYTLTDLATEIKMDQGNLSRYVAELEDKGLIETRMEERERGRPLKYSKLTENAWRILRSMLLTVQPLNEEKPQEWQINKVVDTLKDPDFSNDLRESVVHIFFSFCQKDPVYMIENENVKKLFEEVVANPLIYGEKIEEKLRASVSFSFNRLLNDEKWSSWISGELYPLFVQHMENREVDIKVRLWAIKKVGDVARLSLDQSKKNNAENKLIEIWFAGDTEPDSNLGKEVKKQVLWLTSKTLFETVYEKTKSKDSVEKTKAESLIKDIIISWRPRLQKEVV